MVVDTHSPNVSDEYDDEEIARRRDQVLKHMLNTPPKPRASNPPRTRKTTALGQVAQRAPATDKS